MVNKGLRGHALVFVGFLGVCLAVLWPMWGSGSPSGVDSPTFLHLAWVTEQALLGRLDNFATDPYWYGGYPYLQAYPPLAYLLPALVAVVSPIPLEVAYRILTSGAYVALAITTYWLALELGAARLFAVLAGLLAILSYPVFVGLGVFGWFSTLVALPFGVAGFILVERSVWNGSLRHALVGGSLLGVSVLAHHMTGIGLGLGLIPWGVYHFLARTTSFNGLARIALWWALGFTAVAGLWSAFFVVLVLDVNFEREISGIWEFPLGAYREQLFSRGLIGAETYPTYLGWVQVPLAIAGVLLALTKRGKATGTAILLLVLTWFSLGATGNPLVRHYPFSGLDVARLALFMVPFMAALGAYVLSELWDQVSHSSFWRNVSPTLRSMGVVSALLLLLVVPTLDMVEARSLLTPTTPTASLGPAMQWLAEETDESAKVFSVGFRFWDAYWVPLLSGRRIMDGWNDEGAKNWRLIREVRYMGWLRDVDTARFHEVLGLEGTDYVMVYSWDFFDAPDLYLAELRRAGHLFQERAAWPDLVIFERIDAAG